MCSEIKYPSECSIFNTQKYIVKFPDSYPPLGQNGPQDNVVHRAVLLGKNDHDRKKLHSLGAVFR